MVAKMKGGDMNNISPLVSFLLGVASASACILFFMSANGTGWRSAEILAWSSNGTHHHRANEANSIQEITVDVQQNGASVESDGGLRLGPSEATSNVAEVAAPSAQLSPFGDLAEVLKKAANKDNTVIVTQINDAWTAPGSLLDLFFESFHVGEGVEPLLKHLVIVTMDQHAYDKCKQIHQHCYFFRTDQGINYSTEKVFMSKDYLEMMWGRNRFQQTILELGYNFLFTDVDVMWFRDPFKHIAIAADISISTDFYGGEPYNLGNYPNGGFLYVKSCDKTIEFYKNWQQGRWRFFGKHEQDVFNLIKHELSARLQVTVQFLDNRYISGFCQLSKELNNVHTLHANCCVGLRAKLHDLRNVLDDWKNYTSRPLEERKTGHFQWRLPGICIH